MSPREESDYRVCIERTQWRLMRCIFYEMMGEATDLMASPPVSRGGCVVAERGRNEKRELQLDRLVSSRVGPLLD